MNARQFFDLTAAVREAQRAYFKNRTQSALRQSKALEAQLDAEIRRVKEILQATELEPVQPSLFPREDAPNN